MSTKVLLRVISLAVLLSVSAYAVDGVVLINQATVMAAGGFPYKITQSGSYKLSGNLVVDIDANAIEIDADNVLLDLNGFTITDASGFAIIGQMVDGLFFPHPGLKVMNGVIVAKGGLEAIQATVRNVSVTVSGFGGISLNIGTVTGCTVTANSSAADGIFISGGGVVAESTVRCFPTGIFGNNLHVTNNLIIGNTTGLFGGATSGYGSNTFANNGVDVAAGISMKNNVCSNNSVC